MFKFKLIIFFSISSVILSDADRNEILGFQCSVSENATLDNEYQINLRNLMNSLAGNNPTQAGFFTATSGKGSGKIYGLTQCRADVSASDCAACIKNSTNSAAATCSGSKNVTVWLRWCLLRYSNTSFFGVLDESAMATANETNIDDPYVVYEGTKFMNELASTAPKMPLMFQTAVLDVGRFGKRYGMCQCSRDLGRRNCGSCLGSLLQSFRISIGNKRGWEIYGSSCSLWYHDFQFYFNYSIPSNSGYGKFIYHQGGVIGILIPRLVFYFITLY
ncbi:cysteine-rich repeat secretory protein 38-like [Euphorbia lathyris]|uniref:cysteine-rich repeat secretory protein 38-like n=1 Tax=Euphorbia lathyris TaxID=212925 RepID=UPI0033136D6D